MSFFRHGEIYHYDEGATPQDHALAHRNDEFPAGYSSAGCSPAVPASASPASAIILSFTANAKTFAANGKLSLISLSQLRGAVGRLSPSIFGSQSGTSIASCDPPCVLRRLCIHCGYPTTIPHPCSSCSESLGLSSTFRGIFAADLRQPTEAHDLEPLHSFTRSTVPILPPFVDCEAERTDRIAFRAESEFRCVPQKPDQSYSVDTLAHEFCPPSSSKRNLRLTRSPANTSI